MMRISAKKLLALFAALMIGLMPQIARTDERAYLNLLIQYYADYYDVPVELVHRVVIRESTYNPRARNGPYWGLMQILPETARTMGFRGKPEDLLDAETNLIYAVKYLRGAYIVADGNHDAAVRHYASGYYYAARDKGLLEVTGLRPGPLTPVAPTPPTQVASAPVTPPPPVPTPQFEAPIVAALAVEPAPAAPLGFLPPTRPSDLVTDSSALAAIAAVETPPLLPPAPQDDLGASILTASAYMETGPNFALRPSVDMFEGTFALLEAIAGVETTPQTP